MPTHSKRKMKSYMQPVAKRVTIQKPVQKPKSAAKKMLPDGFTRINEVTIRKVYKQF